MKFKKHRDVNDPVLATEGSAGYDLFLPNDHEEIVLHPKQTYKILLGIAVEIPKFHVGLLLPRSSTGCSGLSLQNTCGVIDSDFRDPMQIRARNWHETQDVVIKPGERFAQLVVVPYLNTKVEIVDNLSETDRLGGFGSSGSN